MSLLRSFSSGSRVGEGKAEEAKVEGKKEKKNPEHGDGLCHHPSIGGLFSFLLAFLLAESWQPRRSPSFQDRRTDPGVRVDDELASLHCKKGRTVGGKEVGGKRGGEKGKTNENENEKNQLLSLLSLSRALSLLSFFLPLSSLSFAMRTTHTHKNNGEWQ